METIPTFSYFPFLKSSQSSFAKTIASEYENFSALFWDPEYLSQALLPMGITLSAFKDSTALKMFELYPPARPLSPAMAMPETGLAGMLQGSPYKQKKAFDFIIDGDKEITLHVDK